MLVSVVIPARNAERYIGECLASVCSQAFGDTGAAIEVIVVDDGSVDTTPDLVRAMAARDPRVRPLYQANAGVSAARNTGLDAAMGEYVAFVDADDRLLPGALDALYAVAAASGPAPDIVSSLLRELYPDGRTVTIRPARTCRVRDDALALLIEGDGIYNSMCGKLYRRERLNRWGVRARPGLRVGEDALFNLEAYARAGHTAHLPVVTYEYRIHGDSAMCGIPKAEHYARHLPWLEGMREALSALRLREAFFRQYCDSHALRMFKERGLSGVLRDFNRDARPAVLEGVDRTKLRWNARLAYAAVHAGLFPPVYCAALTARRCFDYAAGRILRLLRRRAKE